jgi:hypothetical protein
MSKTPLNKKRKRKDFVQTAHSVFERLVALSEDVPLTEPKTDQKPEEGKADEKP